MDSVAVFTDTYLPTVNGVTYTITDWRERWLDRGGRMDVVYPHVRERAPLDGEYPIRSVRFPFYEGYRIGLSRVPHPVRDVDIVHVHTPFTIGFAGLRLARGEDLPIVASYHTPTGEYTDYLAPGRIAGALRWIGESWERLFFDRVDLVLAPSGTTREHLREAVGVSTPVRVLSNGVDVDRFEPVDPSGFVERYGLDTGRPLVGYTGRHGYEKCLHELIDAAAGLDATVVFGGDGPARDELERRAAKTDADVRFLGFLDREELPAFYSALDVFGFPSPVETQGIVALEAMACGTPIVGVNRGALAETIADGVTGYHFEDGDTAGFRAAIARALEDRERLRGACLDRRDDISVERSIDELETIYGSL